MPNTRPRNRKGTGAERKRRRKLALRAAHRALEEHPELVRFVGEWGARVKELYERMSTGTLDETEGAHAWNEYEELGSVFQQVCGAWIPVPEALHAAIWRHIATTGGIVPMKHLPDDCNEAVQVMSIEEHAQAWDGAPVPHVVLRVDLLSVVEQDLRDVIRVLKERRGLKKGRGTKAAKEFRAMLAARAMARRVLRGNCPACIDESKWSDTCAAWTKYAETGRVDSYVADSVCRLYSDELCVCEQISPETVESALRRRWREGHKEGRGSLENLLGFRLDVPSFARSDWTRPPEPWVSSTFHSVTAPWC